MRQYITKYKKESDADKMEFTVQDENRKLVKEINFQFISK